MSIQEVKVPQLSESVAEATLLEWKKKPGDAVKADEILIEIETDKVVLEVPAPASGVLTEILRTDGSTVASGELIARVDTEAKAVSMPAAVAMSSPAAMPAPMSAAAMPAAAKLMAETGISLTSGTGRDGRITKGDVLAAAATPMAPATSIAAATPATAPLRPAPVAASPPMTSSALPPVTPQFGPEAMLNDRPEQRVPMSRLRARVAERLVQSQSTNAILTTFNEVNMAPVMSLRKQYAERFEKEHGVKLGFMSFFVKACIAALKEFPAVNAEIDGDEIVYKNFVHMGIAVGGPSGLVVPVLRNADTLGFAEIEKRIGEFGKRARDGALKLDELAGGSFTITNGGIYGSLMSTPILNPPQSGILGMHKIQDRPMAVAGKIEIRPMMYIALSYDHRIVDGKEAVSFLVRVKESVEDPRRLMLDI